MVTKLAVSVVLIVAAVLGFQLRDLLDDKLREDNPLIGKWKITAATIDGQETDEPIGFTIEFAVDGQYSVLDRDGNQEYNSIFNANSKGDIWQLRLETNEGPDPIKGGGGPQLGIFRVNPNPKMRRQIIICLGKPGARRPGSFETKTGDGKQLLVIEASEDK